MCFATVCFCVFVCMCVFDCVFGNSENVQTVYKVRKLVTVPCAHVCKSIFDSIHVRFNHLCSFLPVNLFTSVLMNYTKAVTIATTY